MKAPVKNIPASVNARPLEPSRAEHWRGYVQRSRLPGILADVDGVSETIRGFLGPVRTALAEDEPFERTWVAGGPWR